VQIDRNSQQIEESVWQAWLKKSEMQDRLRYERRLKALALLAVFLVVSALLWKFIG
jgi:type VI protein secretion system component VasF